MKTILAAAAAALIALAPLRAEAPLSLEDCRQIAAQRQPALAMARAGIVETQEGVGEARSTYYPQLDLNAGYHRWQRRAFLPSGLALPGRALPELIGPLDDWNGGLVSRLTLFDFGERRAGLDAAKATAAGAEADAKAIRANVRLEVATAFYTLAAAEELEAVAQKNVARSESHRQLAIARRDAGAVPQADVLRLEAELADARLQLIAAASRVRIAAGQLNTAMGRSAETPVTIAKDVPAPPPPAEDLVEQAIAHALANRPELAAAAQRIAAAKAALTGARANRAPKLRADAAYGWRDTELWPQTNEWQAGVSVDLPLFDGGGRTHRVRRSQAEVSRQEAAMEQRRLEIRNEAWAAASELQRAWASIDANQTNVQASAESLRVVRERYERGAALVTDLLDTQTALARAESSLAESRWTYCAARSAFGRAVGAPLP